MFKYGRLCCHIPLQKESRMTLCLQSRAARLRDVAWQTESSSYPGCSQTTLDYLVIGRNSLARGNSATLPESEALTRVAGDFTSLLLIDRRM